MASGTEKIFPALNYKEGKILLCKQCLYFFVVLFLHDCSCFVATFGQLFTLRPPIIFLF